MYRSCRILAFIPARGGSKGIPHKNITPLAGEPLIAYTIKAAKESIYIDDVIISTDSESIAEVARDYGAQVPFMRPADLSGDKAKIIEAVLHGLDTLQKKGDSYDVLVLLQPTQPLRTSYHIDRSIESFFHNGERPLVSVSQVTDSPLLIRSINENGDLLPLLSSKSTVRRQDMPAYYRVNGCIYINKTDELTLETSFNDNNVPFIMEKQYALDIDEPEDLQLADFYLRYFSRSKYNIT